MRCHISSASVPCTWLSVRPLNFGQDMLDLPTVRYDLDVSLNTLEELMSDFYRDYVEDDRQFPSERDPEITRKLRGLGWPALGELAATAPRLLEEFIVQCLAYDCLTHLFAAQPVTDEVKYIINSVDRVEVKDDAIRFSGKALEKQ